MAEDNDEKRKTKLMHELDAWPHNLVEFERSYDQLYGTGIYGTEIIFEHVFSQFFRQVFKIWVAISFMTMDENLYPPAPSGCG